MATRAQVQQLLDEGHDYLAAADRLGIVPGEAYLPSSPLRLVGPPPVNPMRHPDIDAWVRDRARRELST